METGEEKWRNWNWRSEGDIMANGAYFVASGEGVEVKYEKAYSVEPKSADFLDQITMNAGVLIHRSFYFPSFSLFPPTLFLFLSLHFFPPFVLYFSRVINTLISPS